MRSGRRAKKAAAEYGQGLQIGFELVCSGTIQAVRE